MKWYEKQKQAYQNKLNENEEPAANDEIDSSFNAYEDETLDYFVESEPTAGTVDEKLDAVVETIVKAGAADINEPAKDNPVKENASNKQKVVAVEKHSPEKNESEPKVIEEAPVVEEVVKTSVQNTKTNKKPNEPAKTEAVKEQHHMQSVEEAKLMEPKVKEKPAAKATIATDKQMENLASIVDENLPKTTSTISEDTELLGNIKMNGHMNIFGKIIGDIDCTGNVHLYGMVEGNIGCCNIVVEHANITGNITCTGKTEILGTSEVHGDIESQELLNEGQITGDLTVHGGIILTSSAYCEGNIAAQSLASEKGSTMKGQFAIINPSKN